jgi:predicted short-subunit dehydrogenase-like oxidoreductase (DUF2520 family)
MVGTGNLATHLATALRTAGFQFVQVLGRTRSTTKTFAKKFRVPFTTEHAAINPDADLYFLCVNDDSLHELAAQLRLKNKLVIHVSGSVPMEVLDPVSTATAVFYPLYTFSKEDNIDFKDIPVFIEANNRTALRKVKQIASSLSKNVIPLSSAKREKLHLAAVFSSNFTNYLYALASELLQGEKAGEFKYMLPLVRKTVQKLENLSPERSQTGPARRHDKKTIEKHKALLKKYPEQKEVYELLSSGIEKRYRKKK